MLSCNPQFTGCIIARPQYADTGELPQAVSLCHRLVFTGEDYAGDYWYDVDDVKAWVSNTLKTFDFERRSLVMLALW